jgi:DNA-binding CsgD family transcriptional regulator
MHHAAAPCSIRFESIKNGVTSTAMNSEGVEDVRLTGREREVLVLLAQGLQLDEIGQRLEIGLEAVRTHVRKAGQRLGAANRTHAVAIAIRRNLI